MIAIFLFADFHRHTDAVQCLAFNPVTHHLLSCAVTELGVSSMCICLHIQAIFMVCLSVCPYVFLYE